MGTCSIIESHRGFQLDSTLPYVDNIVKFCETNIPGL